MGRGKEGRIEIRLKEKWIFGGGGGGGGEKEEKGREIGSARRREVRVK